MRGPPTRHTPMRAPPRWTPPMCPPPKPPPANLASAEVEKLKTMSSAKAAPPRVASLLAMDLLRVAACPPASCKDNADLQGIPSRRWRRPSSHALFAALAGGCTATSTGCPLKLSSATRDYPSAHPVTWCESHRTGRHGLSVSGCKEPGAARPLGQVSGGELRCRLGAMLSLCPAPFRSQVPAQKLQQHRTGAVCSTPVFGHAVVG